MNDNIPKPAFDEDTLGKLLEAAFVLQEHSRSLAHETAEHIEPLAPPQTDPPNPPWAGLAAEPDTEDRRAASAEGGDFTLTLAHVVETQHQIHMRRLTQEAAASLVAEHAARIANASGAAIGMLEDDGVRTVAAHGSSALAVGTKICLPQALSKACLRTGHVIRCSDLNPEFLVDADECRRRGIHALIAVPIYGDGEVAGTLEVYFAHAQSFTDQDLHSCQLMAGLITEVLARDQRQMRNTPSAENSTAQESLEYKTSSAQGGIHPCLTCGHPLTAGEQFCGKCGAARLNIPDTSVPDAWDPVWRTRPGTLPESTSAESPSNGLEPGQSSQDVAPPVASEKNQPATGLVHLAEPTLPSPEDGRAEAAPAATLVKVEADAWSSAAEARDFLEAIAASGNSGGMRRFWRSHRGDLYLAAAVVLVAVVIRWGIWSSPVGASSGPSATLSGRRRKIDPQANLSVSDKILVSLGMADPPDVPDYKGNPDRTVWVDLHSALYYCPGSDSYGKTPRGKFQTQRDAQLDQYEPADRKACE